MVRFSRITANMILLLAASQVAHAATPGLAAAPSQARPVGREIVAVEDARGARFEVFSDGSHVVVWGDPDGVTLKARLFGADHRPRSEAFIVGAVTVPPTLADRGGWDLAVLGDREAWALAWAQRPCENCPSAIFLSVYDGAVPRFEGELVAAGATHRYLPVVAAGGADAGPIAVGWTLDHMVPQPPADGDNVSDVFARLYDVDGRPRGEPFRVNEDEADEQTLRDAVFLPSGDIVFLWESYEGEGDFYDVVQRLFDIDGVPRGGEARVHEGRMIAQFAPAVTLTGSGYLVVWTDWSYTLDFDGAIVGRRFLVDGTPAEPEFLISPTEPAADRDGASAAGAADGSFVVLWGAGCAPFSCTDDPDGPDGSLGGVFGRSFGPGWKDGDGTGDESGEMSVPVETRGHQTAPVVRAVPAHGYLALWQSQSSDGGPNRVVLRHLREASIEGNPPVPRRLLTGN